MMVGQEGDRTGVKKEEMRGTGLKTCSCISSPGMFFFPLNFTYFTNGRLQYNDVAASTNTPPFPPSLLPPLNIYFDNTTTPMKGPK